MPTYEYQCTSCGYQLEAFQKISDAPLTECPECHKATLSKLISATAFQLKGTGWYVTDFRDKGKPKTKENEGGESSSEAKATNDATTKDAKTTEKKEDKPKDIQSNSRAE